MNRAELEQRLDAIAARVPALRDTHVDKGDLLAELAGELDLVEDAAYDAQDALYVANRVDRILSAAGCLVL
jgi:hypothetical protein